MSFTSANPNKTVKCYGKSNKSTTRPMSTMFISADLENVVPDSSPGLQWCQSNNDDTLSTNSSILNAGKKRNQPVEDDTKHSRVRHTINHSKTKITSVKQTKALRDVLMKGHVDDVAHLRSQVEDFKHGRMPGVFNLSIAAPNHWAQGSKARFQDWILKLGFESQSSISSIYIYPNEVSLCLL